MGGGWLGMEGGGGEEVIFCWGVEGTAGGGRGKGGGVLDGMGGGVERSGECV